MKQFAAPLMVLLASACVTARQEPSALPAGPIAIGEHARVGPYIVTPVSVIEDSRCPVGVRCIFSGRLVVLAQVERGRTREPHAFTLGIPLPLKETSLTLTAASPGRFAEISPKAADYRFTFAASASG